MMTEAVLIVTVVFLAVVAMIKILSDTATRNKLIRQGMVDDKVKQIFARDARLQRLSSLKWGLVLVAIGLALLIGQLFEEYLTDQATFGLMFILAGLAFFVYYGVAQKYLNGSSES